MRISESRYQNDRRRLQLALRFLKYDARTEIIRTWTGLSHDRIRKLYKSYLAPNLSVPRHRGKSPQRIAYFWRTTRMQREAGWLASLMTLLGVIPVKPDQDVARQFPGLKRGKLLCDAFQAYRAMVSSAQISFDHAVFLATSLASGDKVRLITCPACGSLMVVDPALIRVRHCHQCDRQTAGQVPDRVHAALDE